MPAPLTTLPCSYKRLTEGPIPCQHSRCQDLDHAAGVASVPDLWTMIRPCRASEVCSQRCGEVCSEAICRSIALHAISGALPLKLTDI